MDDIIRQVLQMYLEYEPYGVKFARRYTRNREDARDLYWDSAIRRAPTVASWFDPSKASLKTVVFTWIRQNILREVESMRWRDSTRRGSRKVMLIGDSEEEDFRKVLDRETPAEDDPAKKVEKSDFLDREEMKLRWLIHFAPKRFQKTIDLAFHGKTAKEIAECRGISLQLVYDVLAEFRWYAEKELEVNPVPKVIPQGILEERYTGKAVSYAVKCSDCDNLIYLYEEYRCRIYCSKCRGKKKHSSVSVFKTLKKTEIQRIQKRGLKRFCFDAQISVLTGRKFLSAKEPVEIRDSIWDRIHKTLKMYLMEESMKKPPD